MKEKLIMAFHKASKKKQKIDELELEMQKNVTIKELEDYIFTPETKN